jgi:hypothetical protein
MGILVMISGTKRSRLLLSSSNLVGRHWRCDLCIPKEVVPLHWIEIRWFDSYWGWRALSADDKTSGSGALMENGWRKWKRGKLSLSSEIHLELTDDAPPDICFEHTETKQRKSISDMNGLITISGKGVRLSDDDTETIYTDGSIAEIEGMLFRVHIPRNWNSSSSMEMDMGHPDVMLDIDIKSLKATFTQGRVDCRINGEPVRLLYIYALIKKKSPHKYVSTEEVFLKWVEQGGTETSPLERLNWERAKIKNHLTTKGVRNTEKLFIRKKEKRKWMIQISITAKNILLIH